MVKRLSQNI